MRGSSKYYTQQDELARTQDDLNATSEQLKDAEDILVTSENEKSTLQAKAAQAEKLAAENAQLQKIVDDLKKKGAHHPRPTAPCSSPRTGCTAGAPKGDVVFAPGSDKLTKDGERILKDLAGQLKKNSQPVQVWVTPTATRSTRPRTPGSAATSSWARTARSRSRSSWWTRAWTSRASRSRPTARQAGRGRQQPREQGQEPARRDHDPPAGQDVTGARSANGCTEGVPRVGGRPPRVDGGPAPRPVGPSRRRDR